MKYALLIKNNTTGYAYIYPIPTDFKTAEETAHNLQSDEVTVTVHATVEIREDGIHAMESPATKQVMETFNKYANELAPGMQEYFKRIENLRKEKSEKIR